MATPTYFKGTLKTDALIVDDVEISQAAYVAPAAGAAPTAEEFDALLTSLTNAGLLAPPAP
jgi:hypothetical protein